MLNNLPNILKNIKDVNKIKQKAKSFNLKRNYDDLRNEEIIFPEDNSGNPQPKKQKLNVKGDISTLGVTFSKFCERFGTGLTTNVNVNEKSNDTKFAIVCPECGKEVVLSYKLTKKQAPCFVRTNWDKHKCNKTNNRAVLQEIQTYEIIGEDSGFNEM